MPAKLLMPGSPYPCFPDRLPDIAGWDVTVPPHSLLPAFPALPLWTDESLTITVSAEDDHDKLFWVAFPNIVAFELNFATREISVFPFCHTYLDAISHLLVDQIWPRLIAHEGMLVLHASGVAAPEGAMLIAGPSGRGKSTLAASLHQGGYALLGDDAIVISLHGDQAGCRAVYPSMRLFPDSIACLFPSATPQSPVAHYTAKRNLHLGEETPEAPPLPIRAIWFLDRDDGHSDVTVERLSPSIACMKMVEHSFWLDPTDLSRTSEKLRLASRMAESTPAFSLNYPRSFARLDEVHTKMLAVLG